MQYKLGVYVFETQFLSFCHFLIQSRQKQTFLFAPFTSDFADAISIIAKTTQYSVIKRSIYPSYPCTSEDIHEENTLQNSLCLCFEHNLEQNSFCFSPTRPSGPSWSNSCKVCLCVVCPLPMQFFCVAGLVQSVPRPWTGAISISSRALKTRMCSGV